jgi:hypothetical protein
MKRVLALAVTAIVAAAATPALAQMKVRRAPTRTGPLTTAGRRCDADIVRAAGRIRGRLVVCRWLFSMDPGSENNTNRDFGVLWIQAKVNPENGWCAKRAPLRLFAPSNARVLGRSPRSLTTSEHRSASTGIVADAQGAAATQTTVRKSFILHPRRLTRTFDRELARLRIAWAGDTRRTVAFAAGMEISWPQGQSLQEGRFGFRPTVGVCRP